MNLLSMNFRIHRQISVPIDLSIDALRDRADIALRSCFSFFKTQPVSAMELCQIALDASCISLSEYYFISKLSDFELQIEKVLKFVIKKGKRVCFKFIKQLHFQNHSSVIAVLSSLNYDSEIDLGENRILTAQFLQNETNYLSSQIKIKDLLDMLFEKEVLTVEEHDEIQSHKRRPKMRKSLLSILFKKRNDIWLSRFIRCLMLTNHEGMLITLRSRASSQRRGTSIWQDQPSQFLARISNEDDDEEGRISPNHETTDGINLIAQCVNAGLIDYWYGSLFLLLCTANPEKMNDIIRMKDVNTLKILLDDLFSTNPSLVERFGIGRNLKFELEERHNSEFLGKRQGRKSMVDMKYFSEDCLHCFHETVQRNYTEILDEIEDDIIKDVISKCPNISTYAKEMCLDVHKTRVESATIFLQLALANDFILEGLRDSLKRLSLAHFIPFRCQICKEGNCMKEPSTAAEKATFFFKLQKSENGTIEVVIRKKEDDNGPTDSQLPGLRKLYRSKSAHLLYLRNIPVPALSCSLEFKNDSSHRKRVVVITDDPDQSNPVVDKIVNMCKKKFKACTLAMSASRSFNDEVKMNCITSMSPGPHAFLIICEFSALESLEFKMQQLVKYFGSKVLSYVLLLCILKNMHPVKAAAVIRNLNVYRDLENNFLTVDVDSVQDNQLLDTLQRTISEFQTDAGSVYFTNNCFELSERRIEEEKKTIDNIVQYRIDCLQEKIQSLEQLDTRQKATNEVAKLLICKQPGNQKSPLDSC